MTEVDAAVRYDRQIRLWGTATQQSLQNAHVFAGTDAVGSELVKNLVLAGVGHLHLSDGAPVTFADMKVSCVYRETLVRLPRATAAASSLRSLNPLVDVRVVESQNELVDGWLREPHATVGFLVIANAGPRQIARLCSAAQGAPGRRAIIALTATREGHWVNICETMADIEPFILSSPASQPFMAKRPLAVKRAALELAMRDVADETVPERAAALADAIAALDLTEHVEPADLVLGGCQATETVLTNAVVGGVVCQQVIGRLTQIASTATGSGSLFTWAFLKTHSCLMGTVNE
jgi:hypothetical protein